MFKKMTTVVIAIAMVSMISTAALADGFYEDGGLVGLAANGVEHVATDPAGAIGTATEAVVDTTVKGGEAVVKAGAVCTEGVIIAGGALLTDPFGATATAAEAVANTAVAGGEAVVEAGVVCVEVAANGVKHVATDPVGAIGTAAKCILDGIWGAGKAVVAVAVGK